ncbi:MAG TPA: D-alanyl-D-alanine carboxypeptidase/D-alanyl-D-alanine-endopeptidase [Bryobacteraceae bacterium]|nr:D-alanyl-D-alanine carboxypeptidase/D-alanyl-D-alanine-endopeptidase [Bryobacteraceae bacterium]
MPRVLLLWLMLAPLAASADFKSKIDQVLANSPALSNAFIGIQVSSLNDGQTLYQLNSDRLFTPASNMKLFTTALALLRLGPEYRFRTQLAADHAIDATGALEGDLVFIGGGDPSLSGRTYPYEYRPGSAPGSGYSFRGVEELAGQLIARGLKRIDGNIIGDDRRYRWEPHPDPWSIGDSTWEYGAPVSALILNDNSLALMLRPGTRAGDLAQLWLSPPLEYFSIDNRVRTESDVERKLEIERKPASRELRLRGVLPMKDPGESELLAIDDPALYAAEVLRDALQRRGVAIHGQAVMRHRFADDAQKPTASPEIQAPVVLAERVSPPLSELLQVVDKVSQNLHAEVLLREVGFLRRHNGSRAGGIDEIQEFLREIGVAKEQYVFTDGSGLSRSTLVTPAAIATLLAFMYKSSYRELWTSLLPIGGVDGTLATRFHDHPEAASVHAKTGTLAHVRALSGYVSGPDRPPLAFSILVNNANAPASDIAQALDRIVLALLD